MFAALICEDTVGFIAHWNSGSHGALFKTNSGECVLGPCVGANLLRLDLRVDADDMVQVRAPESMRDEYLSAWTGV